MDKKVILIYGGNGWIGGKVVKLLENGEGVKLIIGKARLEDCKAVLEELMECNPSHVICAAGLTGRPNVDWCESHKVETLRINTIYTSVLADICHSRGIHLTYFGTGCIYEYDETHPTHSGIGFTEEEKPNFDKSFYSRSKTLTEKILKEYDNVLILRIRMPLSDELHPRNFITKITKYEKVVNIPNSMTILHDLLPVSVDMCLSSKTGVYNFTNPGTASHNEILDLYKKYIDPEFVYQNFSLEEQSKILKAGRSNNELDSSKLLIEYPYIEPIQVSIRKLFERMRDGFSA